MCDFLYLVYNYCVFSHNKNNLCLPSFQLTAIRSLVQSLFPSSSVSNAKLPLICSFCDFMIPTFGMRVVKSEISE